MKNLTGLLFLLLLIGRTHGQTPDTTMKLSIKAAVDYALLHQKDVLNAELDAEIAKAKVNETIGIGLPQLNGSFDLKDFQKIPTQLIPAEFFGGPAGTYAPIQFGTRWNATAGLNATQLLFDPTYLVGVSAAKTYRELTVKNLQRTRLETSIAVTKAYYSLLLMRERKKVIDKNVQRLEKLFNDTKAMYTNGFIEKIDLDRIQVTYNNILSEEEKMGRFIDLTERNLKFQMGLPDYVKVEIINSLDEVAVKNLSIEVGFPELSKRIEYSILKTQEQLQMHNIRRYKGQYLPSLVAYGSLQANALRTTFNLFESGFRWYPTGIIGATLTINIFDGLQKNYRIKQENLALNKVRNEMSNFENAVVLEVTAARTGLRNALSTLVTTEENLDLAENIVNTSKLKYDQGVGSNLEILDAEASLKEAQANYFNALYDAIIAKIDLDKSLGIFNY